MTAIPGSARDLLERGVLCYLAAPSSLGPHVTPVVFVLNGGQVWGTTSRGTTKVRRWREDAAGGGLVRMGDRAVAFRGRVTLHDALDPTTWPTSLRRAPKLARASARFTLKNALFFAGYARDVAKVPLAWTPPARVAFSVGLDAGLILDDGRIMERWGRWGRSVEGLGAFRAVGGGLSGRRLPQSVRGLLAEPAGDGVVGLATPRGPVVLPARWVRWRGAYLAVLPRRTLTASGLTPGPAALVVDRASVWRARDMLGILLRGDAAAFLPADVRTGGDVLAARIAAAGAPPDPAVVRIRPRSAVWWEGWASGTVRTS